MSAPCQLVGRERACRETAQSGTLGQSGNHLLTCLAPNTELSFEEQLMSLREVTNSPLFYLPVILFFMGRIVFFGPTPDSVRTYLEEKGYKQAKVQGPVGGCGKGSHGFNFTALSPNVGETSGLVCAGIFGFFDPSISPN
jgi:hypothetical protein